MKNYSRITAGVASVALIFGLGGCANPLEAMATKGAEKFIGDIASKEGVDLDVGIGGDATLTKKWPQEVPEPTGKVIMSLASDDGVQAMIGVEKDTVEKYLQLLSSSGFELTNELDMGELKSWTYDSSTYSVNISQIGASGDEDLAMQILAFPVDAE